MGVPCHPILQPCLPTPTRKAPRSLRKNILQFQKSLSGSFKDKLSWLDKPQPPLRRRAYRTSGSDVTPRKQLSGVPSSKSNKPPIAYPEMPFRVSRGTDVRAITARTRRRKCHRAKKVTEFLRDEVVLLV